MAKKTLNNFLKHKRIIIFSLIVIGFAVLIACAYILTYVNNRPVLFKDKANKAIKPDEIELFDMNINVGELQYKNGSTNGKMKFSIEISDLKQDIKNVEVFIELNSNWTDTYTDGSSYKFENGGTLKKDKDFYAVTNGSVDIKHDYPIKVLPFVKVTSPNIYAKIKYTKTTPNTVSEEVRTETIYVVYTWDDYFTSTSKYI